MSKILDAVNILLGSIGEEQVVDLTEPSALMAKSTLDFVLTELPYTDADFVIDYETLPQEVYSFVVIRGARKFQAGAVSSETLHAFTLEDEVNAKRLLIRKKLIPADLLAEVDAELEAMLSYASKVPTALRENLALVKLQALLFVNPEEYVLNPEFVTNELLDLKKNLILTRDVPLEVLQKMRDQYYARYGFSGVIPLDITVESDATQMLRFVSAYEFQKAILPQDQYVITPEEKLQDELDFRMAIIANKLYPADLYDLMVSEFISTYGITQSDFTPPMREYILTQTMFKLQSVMIPNEEQRPITLEDIDNAEATLLARLIVPREMYNRAIAEIRVEFGISEDVLEADLPEAVKIYAKTKSALIHQPTAIRYPSKYMYTQLDVMKAKALAGQSLPTLSLMDGKGVARILDRDVSPEPTSGTTSTKLRLTTVL